MARVFGFLVCLFISIFQLVVCAEEESDPSSSTTILSIYHQTSGQYIKRGTITGLPGVPVYTPSENEVVNLDAKDPFYQIKVKDESTGVVTLASVKVCQMVASDWKDEFTLHLDQDNQFYYLDYYSQSNACPSIKAPIETKPFKSIIHVAKGVKGPRPVLGNFNPNKKVPKTNKATAKVNDEVPDVKEIEEKSFFQKNWYYIIGGLMVVMALSGTPPPETQSQPQRR